MSPEAQLIVELFPYVTAIVITVILCVAVVGSIAFWGTNQGAAKTFSLLVQRGNILQMTTVLLIVTSGFTLAALRILPADGVIALFSGVAGYVLGGVRRPSEDIADSKKPQSDKVPQAV